MALPAHTVWFRGHPACPCLAEWLPVYEAELHRRGTLAGPLQIFQLIGGADASAGTHSNGGAFDITDLIGDEDVWVARQMGADATWARKPPAFVPHLHGVLRGCPHNGPARYQLDAVDDGFNGLGSGGRGGRDDGPRPLSGRTWRQGIAWAKQQQEEDDMQLNDEYAEGKTLRRLYRRLDAFITRQDARAKETLADHEKILGLIEDLPDGHTKAELRRVMREAIRREQARQEEADAEDPR